MGKVARIDTHRARHGAEAVSGTSLVAGIAVLFSSSARRVGPRRFVSAGIFRAATRYAGARKGKAAGETVDFAETALDAFVSYE